jgi:hypothetical protein
MKNIVELDISSINHTEFKVLHNDELVGVFTANKKHQLCLLTIDDVNRLKIIAVNNTIKIDNILMYGMGGNLLAFRGLLTRNGQTYQSTEVPVNSIWELSYSSPVFVWLHQTLNHGWLVPP